MSSSEAQTGHLDYDLAYRGESELGEQMPWDIRWPQPAYVELAKAGRITGTVLDCGCGTGEIALYLAGIGYDVIGLDLAPTAISRAQAKAKERGLDVTFAVADALDLSGYEGRFDTVVDSGMAHVFGAEELPLYAAALHRVCRPQGLVHVLGIDERRAFESQLTETVSQLDTEEPEPGERPLPMISAEALRGAFANGWAVESIDETIMQAQLPFSGDPVDVPALLARIRRR